MTIISALLCAAFAAAPAIENRPADAVLATQWAVLTDEVREMIAQVERGVDADSMDLLYQAKAAWEKLLQKGDQGALVLIAVSRSTQSKSLRSAVFGTLCGTFASHPQVKELILTDGLHSSQSDVRYTCLCYAGEHHWGEACDFLLAQMEDRQAESLHRFAAAKSLAQLGDIRSLPTLIEAALHRNYYPRNCGNVGLAALTGKSLNDFHYQEKEGIALHGLVEIRDGHFDAVKELETHLRRYTACRDYLKWLQNERPELYAALTKKF